MTQMPTLAVLSAATGYMYHRQFADVHKVFDIVLDDAIMTHQIPKAFEIVGPALIRQHPWMGETPNPEILTEEWCDAIVAEHGELADVAPEPSADWVRANGIPSLVEVMGPDRIIGVLVPEKKESQAE